MKKGFRQEVSADESKLTQYVLEEFRPEDAVLSEIRERQNSNRLPMIQVGEMDGLHLEVLTRISGAKKAVEIGTLGGYSGVCIARGLGPQGKLYTFEYSSHHAKVAQESFQKAGLSENVEIFVGPALEQLHKIESQGPFDLVFVDADKANYPNYFKWAEKNLRVGGLLLGDNTFAFGMIADTQIDDDDDKKAVHAIREFNSLAAHSQNFRTTILPTAEGLTVAIKIR